MHAWLSATPDYDIAKAQSAFDIYLTLSLFCIFLSGLLFYFGKKSNKIS